MRLSAQQLQANEARILAVMDRLLSGHAPAGANCDITTLARLADIDRAAFYGNRPYAHLREQFEQRLNTLHDAGQTPNPHQAQIATLKETITTITDRISRRDRTIAELTDFKKLALSQLAAQHQEITRLRTPTPGTTNLRDRSPRTDTDPQPTRPARTPARTPATLIGPLLNHGPSSRPSPTPPDNAGSPAHP